MSPERTRTISPGTSSRAGMSCQFESRRTRALTCNRRRKRFDNAGGAALLREAQDGIDDQERAHHREIGIFPQDQRQRHDQLEHPRRQAPELREKCADRVAFLHGYFVVALRLLTGGGLGAGKPGFRVHTERREGVGYGGGCDVRCHDTCCRRHARGLDDGIRFGRLQVTILRRPNPVYARTSAIAASMSILKSGPRPNNSSRLDRDLPC